MAAWCGAQANLILITAVAFGCTSSPPDEAKGSVVVDPPGPVFAAVVARSGFIVPFAKFEKGFWSLGASGADLADRSAPWFVDGGENPRLWYVTQPVANGGLPDEVRRMRTDEPPTTIGAHCQRAWALASDWQGESTSAPPDVSAGHIVGIGLSQPLAMVPAMTSTPDADQRARVLAAIEGRFDAEESAAKQSSGSTRNVGAAIAKMPLRLDTLIAITRPSGGPSLHAFEATRTYANRRNCDAATVMTGWLVEDGSGRIRVLDTRTNLSDCDRKGNPVVQPLGTARLAGVDWIFAAEHHYEGESYVVYSFDGTAMRRALDVYGGGC